MGKSSGDIRKLSSQLSATGATGVGIEKFQESANINQVFFCVCLNQSRVFDHPSSGGIIVNSLAVGLIYLHRKKRNIHRYGTMELWMGESNWKDPSDLECLMPRGDNYVFREHKRGGVFAPVGHANRAWRRVPQTFATGPDSLY